MFWIRCPNSDTFTQLFQCKLFSNTKSITKITLYYTFFLKWSPSVLCNFNTVKTRMIAKIYPVSRSITGPPLVPSWTIVSSKSKNSHPSAIFRLIFRIPWVTHGTEYTFCVRHHRIIWPSILEIAVIPNAEPFRLARQVSVTFKWLSIYFATIKFWAWSAVKFSKVLNSVSFLCYWFVSLNNKKACCFSQQAF